MEYTVKPGDTAWEIAEKSNQPGDIRGLVDDIHNQNDGGMLEAGSTVTVPGPVEGSPDLPPVTNTTPAEQIEHRM